MADAPVTRFARNGDVHLAYQVVGEHELKGVPDTWRLVAATG